METMERFDGIVKEFLGVSSLPLGVKFLESREEAPKNAGRPLRDLGTPIRPCVGWQLARRNGLSVTMLEEDFSTMCPIGIFVFGVRKPTQSFLDGDVALGTFAGSREAARNKEKNVYMLDADKYCGVSFAPLGKGEFTPDLVMIHCNARHALWLTGAATYSDGEPLKITMSARGLCSDGLGQAFLNQKPVVAIPCGGDREWAGAQDHEMCFLTPVDALGNIIEGLRSLGQMIKMEKLGVPHEAEKRHIEWSKKLDKMLGR